MQNLKLGKLAPKSHPKTLRLSKYLKTDAPPAPPTVDWQKAVPSYPMYLNDKLGCCVFACGGHMIEGWTANATTEFSPTDAQVEKAYEDVGGYVPGDPSTDNGAVITDFLSYWQTTGMAGHKVDGWAQIDQNNFEEVKQAVYIFGGIDIGIQVPQSAMDQFQAGKPWTLQHKSWLQKLFSGGDDPIIGGHSIPILGYDKTWANCITWAKVQPMAWDWFGTYCDEVYAVISLDWLNNNKVAPNHLDLAALQADLQALKAK